MKGRATMNQDSSPLHVIGIGLGRTGTKTLKVALEMLYKQPCYHMSEVVCKHVDHAKLWIDLYRLVEADPCANLPEDLVKHIFKGYANSVGNPGASIYRQLIEIYPNAKLILTIRDARSWIDSVRSTIGSRQSVLNSGWYGRILEYLNFPAAFRKMVRLSTQLALGHTLDATDEQLMEGFSKRNAEIQQRIPTDRLLVYNVQEGWLPLCRFLDKPVPNEPFPHVNDRIKLQQEFDWMKRMAEIFVAVCVTCFGLITAMIVKWVFS